VKVRALRRGVIAMELSRREFLSGPAAAGICLGGGFAPMVPSKTVSQPELETQEPQGDDLTAEFVVVGGGMSGLCAAIQAAREGVDTVIIQDRPVFGGNSSSEVRMHVCGADDFGHRPYARETGIIEEVRLENQVRNAQRSASMWDLFLWEMAKGQPNLRFFLNTSMTGCETEGGRVRGVECFRSRTEKKVRVRGRFFMDATGDATLCRYAGASVRWGREARSEYGESLAPERADPYTMGSTIMFQARDHGRPMPFVRPAWAHEYPAEEDLPHRNHSPLDWGHWWVEWGGTLDIIRDDDAIRDELLSVMFGVWDHVKNRGDHGAEKWALEWFGFIPGRRASYRVIAPYMLRQQDIEAGRVFDDAVAYGGWPMDDHPSLGVRSPEPPCHQVRFTDLYTIPLRSLYSKDVANLFVGGRGLGASHVAFSSTRVMATCAAIGQGIGAAAAKCVRAQRNPGELSDGDIRAVQQTLLRHDAYIPGFGNEDPEDLAREANVTAGSERRGMEAKKVTDGWGRRIGEDAHLWASRDYDPGNAWIQVEFPEARPLGEIHLTFDSDLSKAMTLAYSERNNARVTPGPPGTLVESYRVEVRDGGSWKEAVAVEGNYQRKRVHRFEGISTKAVRVSCLGSVNCDHARVQEVRWYGGR